jgi:hypothetical protein
VLRTQCPLLPLVRNDSYFAGELYWILRDAHVRTHAGREGLREAADLFSR